MENPREITVIQATAVLVSTIIGVGVLPLPLFAVRAANTGAPLVTLLAILVAFVGLWLITRLGMRFPGQSISQYSERIIGRWPALAVSLLLVAFFAVLTALAAREFGAVVVTAVLRRTPLEVTVIIMLLLAVVSARHDSRTFSYIHLFYLPFVLLPGIVIVVLSLKNSNILFLQPFYGNSPPDLLGGVLTVAALFQGSFVMTMVIPYMRKPEKAMIASIMGLLVSGGLYLLIVIAVVAVFGPGEAAKLLWPTLELAKTTALPANILERLDAAFLAIWVTAVFTTLFSSYYLTVHEISKLLRLRDHRMFTYFLMPFIFTLAMIPSNIFQLYEIIVMVGRIGLLLTIGYPGLLLVVSAMRGVRGGQS